MVRFAYEGGQYYRKRYLGRGWLEGVKARIVGSRAERAWRGTDLLETHAFEVPQMIVTGWRGADCFMVTRAVAGGVSLMQYMQGLRSQADREAWRIRRVVAEELGRIVGRMHTQGIVHGDLRWGNVLVVADSRRPRFVFLDNERTRHYTRTPKRRVLKNLVQLNLVPDGVLTRTERMRFWCAYRAEHKTLAGDPKQWIRRVIARTVWRRARRMRKNRRNR
ncbi:MAG TPA: lipopolysaccharide kinase InaA family protein [Sedimentisphaerales bacterium]|nr:lipopolysaccharide kinase InaA family protein [Sedimentisphaerales bacterium]